MARKKSSKRIDYFKYDPVVNKKDTFNIDKALNENWDKTADEFERQDKQITYCLGEIEKVRGEIETAVGGIDLSSVNEHTTQVGEGIKSHVDLVKTTISGDVAHHANNTVSSVNAHTSAVAGDVNKHTTNTAGAINTHSTNEASRVLNHINATRGGIKSVQMGTTKESGNIIISPVNINKSFLLLNPTSGHSSSDNREMGGKFIDASTIYVSGRSREAFWQVVEFY